MAEELAHQTNKMFYWTSSSQAELDFLLQHNDSIYPLEVKSGTSTRKKSLAAYIQKYQPKLALRTSPMNLKLDGNVLNCPLYLMGRLNHLIIDFLHNR